MYNQQNAYMIALTLIPGVGDILAKNLLAYLGSAEMVFSASRAELMKAPKIGAVLADAIVQARSGVLERATEELEFCKKHSIRILPFIDETYPIRLKQCDDAPLVLYVKGEADLNASRIINIVGTRNATQYGKDFCKSLVESIAHENIVVMSGLAYGIDVAAHKAALDNNVVTFGVLGHALDTIYPSEHRNIAKDIVSNGALITEHVTKTKIDASNFITRNRIIAGMSDATIVVESGERGGALLTVEYALSYNRDVCALPGRSTDKYSKGCNSLIKRNKAALIESADDLFYALNWTKSADKNHDSDRQLKLFATLTDDEQLVVNHLQKENDCSIDIICHSTQMSMSKLSFTLFNLEMQGLVKTLPGKCYRLL